MKKLTINRVASAGLRANRRAYLSLAVGVFLSIFLITTLCLCVQGGALAREARVAARVGWEDLLLMDGGETSDERLRETGYFDRIGHVFVTAKAGDVYLGYYDADAGALLNRRCVEGCMPEAPGEIAMERSALEALRLEAAVGDSVTLDLTPIDGAAESRTFTLTGLLNEQNAELNLRNRYFSNRLLLEMPAILTSPEEPPFATGRTILHRPMTLSKGTSFSETLNAADPPWEGWMFGVDALGNVQESIDAFENGMMSLFSDMRIFLIFLGASLAFAACVGIAGALEGQLLRKTEEIGMLRAVGATRRQIRRIFGRESWILAALTSPASIAAGCLCAWGLSRAFPEQILFRPTVSILAPILILSAAAILAASRLPLMRASRVPPVWIMRDVRTLYHARRVRSRKRFSPPWLMAFRQLRLRPLRPLGSSLLIALTFVIVFLAALVGMTSYDALYANMAEFDLYRTEFTPSREFLDSPAANNPTDGDLAQLAALPTVRWVRPIGSARVNLLLDEVTDYVSSELTSYRFNNDHLRKGGDRSQYDLARQAVGTDREMIDVGWQILDVDAAAWAKFVSDGDIDLAALDAGREVLVYAPDLYAIRKTQPDGSESEYTSYDPVEGYADCARNDYFHAGQTLSLARLLTPAGDEGSDSDADLAARFAQARCDRYSVAVGAVLQGDLDHSYGATLITTPKGARALGLTDYAVDEVEIWLSGVPDEDTERLLESRVETIGMRSRMETNNRLRNRREMEQTDRQMTLVLAAIALVFLAVTVGLIGGNVARRVRADARTIGMLRAVGADRRALNRTYAIQVGANVALGLIFGALALVAVFALAYDQSDGFAMFRILWGRLFGVLAALLATILLACGIILRRSVRDVVRRSVIENIREL